MVGSNILTKLDITIEKTVVVICVMSNSPPRKGKISIADKKKKIEQKPEMKRSSSISNESEYDGFIKMLRKDMS